MEGAISVVADCDGTIDINGESKGDISITGDCSGSIDVADDTSGDITVGGLFTGGIHIGGDVTGDIEFTSSGIMTGDIDITGALWSAGRILVTDTWDGDVTIGEGTARTSLMHFNEGIGDNAVITINNSAGNFDAVGDIIVGTDTPGFPPLPTITYDGCIQILDHQLTGDGGDLDGDIEVNGCHATAADLGITVEGTVNGDVIIRQTGCANQVTWDDCPS